MSKTISRFILSTGLIATSMFAAPAVYAQCAAPVSIEGGINYDPAADTLNVCDGTNWLVVGPGGGGGVFELNGSVVRNTGTHASEDFVFGSPQLADVGTASEDARFWFDKSKAAFRAGQANGTQWDDGNVGSDSVAMSYNAQASNSGSIAIGSGSIASGLYSGVFAGTDNQALGNFSVALGGNISLATGANSFAANSGNASGDDSIAMMTGRARGANSISIGGSTIASGAGSFAIGKETRSGSGTAGDGAGDSSFAFGLQSASHATDPRITGDRSAVFFFDGNTANANSTYDFTDSDKFALIGGEFQIDDVSSSANKGCIRYNSASTKIEFSHDCSTYSEFGAGLAADSLDWDDFVDTMTLDATTTIDMATNNADLNFDADTFVIDQSNNAVGIGTNAPTAKLHLSHGIDTRLEELITNTSTGTNVLSRTYHRNTGFQGLYTGVTGLNYTGGWLGQGGNEGFIVSSAGQFNIINAHTNAPMIFWAGSNTAPNEVMRLTYDARLGIGTVGNPDANAALEVTGTNLGFLPPRNADPGTNITGTAGLIAYDSTDNELQYYNGSSWVSAGGGGASAINDLSDARTDYTNGGMYIGQGVNGTTTGAQNTVLGHEAGNALTTGNYNTFIGRLTGFATQGGTQNTFVGVEAGRSNVSGIQNTFIGEAAGYNSTASYNTFMGRAAGAATTSGASNTFIGHHAGTDNQGGNENTYIGREAGNDGVGSNLNTAVGYRALTNFNPVGNGNNVAVGHSALLGVNGASNGVANTAVGNYAMESHTTGQSNTAIGLSAMVSNTTGSSNTALGRFAGATNTTGSFNVAIGDEAMGKVSSPTNGAMDNNVVIGYQAGVEFAGGVGGPHDNVLLGFQAGDNLTTGDNNIIIGSGTDASSATADGELNIGNLIHGDLINSEVFLDAPAAAPADGDLANGQVTFWVDATNDEIELKAKDSAGDVINVTVGAGGGASALNDLSDATTDYTTDFNMFMGDNAGASIASGGQYNLAIGQNAGDAITIGDRNVAIGYNALTAAQAIEDNIAIGYNAAASNNAKNNLIAIGSNAASSYTGSVGAATIAIGPDALTNATDTHSTIAIGERSMEFSATNLAFGTTAIGHYTLRSLGNSLVGNNNTALGYSAGQYLTSGQYNVLLGNNAGVGNTTNYSYDGSSNIFIGHNTGRNLDGTNDQNTIIGSSAGTTLATGNGNILLGYNTDVSSSTASDELNIGNLIYSDLANGQIGVGVTNASAIAASAALEVTGTNLGFLPPRNADPAGNIGTPATGLIAYDTTDNELQYYNGSAWVSAGGGGSSLWTDLTGGRIHYGTTSANQVGVGTNNPGYTLDVNGDINLPVGNTIRAGGNEMLRMIAPNDGSGVHAVVMGTNSAHTNLGAGTGFNQWNAPGVYIGHNAGNSIDTTGGGNQGHVFIGINAGQNATTSVFNTLIGANAGSGTVSFHVTAIGADAGRNAGQSSVYVGRSAGGNGSLTLGTANVAVGEEAGEDATGSYNAFFGDGAGREQRGSNNIAFGANALFGVDTTSTASGNIAIGYQAMDAVTTSSSNVAIGTNAAGALVDGGGVNVFIGDSAGSGANTSSAYRNVSIGAFSGQAAGLGQHNTFLGERSGRDATGNGNTFIGRSAGQSVATGGDNVVLGSQPESGQTFASGNRNILIGANVDTPTAASDDYLSIGNLIYGDLANNEVFLDAPAAAPADGDLANGQVTFWVDATNDEIELKAKDSAGDVINVTVGSGSGGGASNIDGLSDGITDYVTDFNMFMGSNAGASIASGGQYNLAIGQNAGDAITTGDRNIALGYDALTAATTVTDNIAIGYNAATANNTANGLIAIGYNAMLAHNPPVGTGNIAIGNLALRTATDGYGITAIGNEVMKDTGGNGVRDITAVGSGALENIGQNSLSEQTVAVGNTAGIYLRGGSHNTFLGSRAGRGNGTNYSYDGSENVFIGKDSGLNLDNTNNQNTVIGASTAATLAGGSGNILLGYNTDVSSATASNELNIGNLIYGDLANSEVFLDAPAAAPADGDLANGQVTFWVDATNNEIELKAKDSAGDVINATIGSGSSVWTTSGVDIYYNDADADDDVAIGMTVPAWLNGNASADLAVWGEIYAGSDIKAAGTMQADDNELFTWGDWSTNIQGSSATDYISFDTANTERMRIDSSGEVGIGTNSPGAELHVYNSDADVAVRITNANSTASRNPAVQIQNYDAAGLGGYPSFEGIQFRGNSGSPNVVQSGDRLVALLGRGAINTSYGAATAAGIYMQATETYSASAHGAKIYFDTVANGSTTRTTRMTIDHDGDVGIGITNPSVALDVSGDIEYTGTITDVSDARLKENIEPLSNHGSLIDRINKIETVSFTMKDDEKGRTEYGVIAQQLENIFPELVHTADDEMGTKSVNYVGLIAPMIEATKELKSENDALKAEISDIKQDIAGMKLHTGYDINKANIQNLAMMLMMMVFGGACVMVATRFQRKS